MFLCVKEIMCALNVYIKTDAHTHRALIFKRFKNLKGFSKLQNAIQYVLIHVYDPWYIVMLFMCQQWYVYEKVAICGHIGIRNFAKLFNGFAVTQRTQKVKLYFVYTSYVYADKYVYILIQYKYLICLIGLKDFL